MKREIQIFKSFEEQELYFLQYFYFLTPSERLKALSELQKKNYKDFLSVKPRSITIKKPSSDGH